MQKKLAVTPLLRCFAWLASSVFASLRETRAGPHFSLEGESLLPSHQYVIRSHSRTWRNSQAWPSVLCMNFKKKLERIDCMQWDWNKQDVYQEALQQGVVHARSCSTHRLKIFGRSSTPDGRTSMNSSSSESDSSSLDEDAGRWWKTCLK